MAGQRPHGGSAMLWLQPEIAQNLAVARNAVEQHVEDGGVGGLREAAAEIREVGSSAQLIQATGVAIAAGHLAEALEAMSRQQTPDAAACAQAVMSGIVQLDDYCDALAGGLPDHLLALHPMLNELRLALGQPVLSESDLFGAQMVAQCVMLDFDGPRAGAPAATAIARKYEATYQQALVQWLRGGQKAAVGRIGKLAEAFANGIDDAAGHMLWRCMAAVAESVLASGLEPSLDLKRIVGRSGAAVRALAAGTAFDDAHRLAGSLLLHLGRVSRPASRTRALREATALHRYLPDDGALARMRARLHGANSALVQQLSQELRGDLQRVKDHIDLRVRAGAGDMDEARALLDQMGHTLAMLGLPALARLSRNQVSQLATLIEEDADRSHEGWLEIASTLLRVELSLDEALFRQISLGEKAESTQHDEIPTRADLAAGQRALLREARVNLGRIKASVDGWLRHGNEEGLEDGAPQLREVHSALAMLEQGEAAERVAALAELVSTHGLRQLCSGGEPAEAFAEAVSALEFFLESLERGHVDEAMLATFSDRLQPLEQSVGVDAASPAAAAEPAAEAAAAPAAAAAEADGDEVDPDIREVFLEEAAEVQQQIAASYARWRRNPDDADAMLEVRRGFHTLKGSGRMVRAETVGEFAWRCEQLLNACRDGGLAISPAIVDFTGEAVALMPSLVSAFAEGRPVDTAAVEALQARAEQLRRGEAEGGDDLRSIFREDAAAQLGLVSRWLADDAREQVSAEAVRAFHTLRGAAAAINSPHFSASAAAAEQLLGRLRAVGRGVDEAAAECLRSMVDRLRACVDDGSLEAPEAEAADWQRRLQQITQGLPRAERPAAEGLADVEAFALEALDCLQSADGRLRAWRDAPEQTAHRDAAVASLRQLVAAAGGAAALLSRPAALLAEGLSGSEAGDGEHFAALDAVIEGLFGRLDQFRDAPDTPVAEDELEAQLARLFPALADAGADDAEIAADELPELRLDDEDDEHDEDDGGAASDAAPVAVTEPAADPSSPYGWGGASGAAAEADTAVDSEADANELREIFVGEAQELLEAMDRAIAALQRQPDAQEATRELARTLHTLKGSARMAGYDDIGELAHRCENLLPQEGDGEGQLRPEALVPLNRASDGLFQIVEQLRQGIDPDLSGLLAEFDAEAVAETSPEAPPAAPPEAPPETPAEPAAEAPAETPSEAANAGTAPQPLSADTAADAAPDTAGDDAVSAAGAAPDSVDAPSPAEAAAAEAALYDSFAAESEELLRGIGDNLERWQRDSEAGLRPEEVGAVFELQRALHTLRGSARIAEQDSLAAVAQEMEALVADIAQGAVAADSAAFQQLATRFEQLQHLGAAGGGTAVEEDESTYFDSEHIDQLGPREAPAEAAAAVWDPRLTAVDEDEATQRPVLLHEQARVPVSALEGLLNEAGELSVLRARLEQQNNSVGQQLQELAETVVRLRDQLRQLNAETEAQIAARGLGAAAEPGADRYAQDFDPLEMDRYSRMQELSRALAESVGDIEVLQGGMRAQLGESNALLLQQQRTAAELQQGLMGTLMVPFARQTQRLQRVVRQLAAETGRRLRLEVSGEDIEVDRNVLERMTAPIEHALRNAVVHGIETPEAREAAGKPAEGQIHIRLARDGQMLRLSIADDGRGLDYAAIRRAAIERGLMGEEAQLSDAQLALFILEPGFSTAAELTQSAGRGIGMDVLAAEVRQLGGSLDIHSEPGAGTRFEVRLPITLGMAKALIFEVGGETHAVPLPGITGVGRVPHTALGEGSMDYGGQRYQIAWAADYLGLPRSTEQEGRSRPAILLQLPEGIGEGSQHVALMVDSVLGNREIVSKGIGPILASVPGMSGATILPDGRVVLLLDLVALLSDRIRRQRIADSGVAAPKVAAAQRQVMVVDDSITMRRVAERLLRRNGYDVLLARDGVDAMSQLATARPAVVLLDIEMPRADGFEVASYMRNSQALRDTPIVMITSRSGDKHRQRAAALGVQRYLIKPYQETQLLEEIRALEDGVAA